MTERDVVARREAGSGDISGGVQATCPFAGRGQAYQPYEHDGMYEFFADIRAQEPVFWNEELQCWVVTRRQDVLDVLRNPTVFSAANALNPITPFSDALVQTLADGGFTVEPTQVNCEAPKHTRIRQLVARFLNAKNFATYEDRIREITRTHIAAMKGLGTVDIVDALTYEVPAKVLMLLLGVDDVDPRKIKSWGDLRLLMTFGKLSEEECLKAGGDLLDYWHYCKRLVAERLDNPGSDYASAMITLRDGDDAVLSVNEIVCLMFGIMLAGHETTTNATSNLILELMRHRDQWEKLKQDPSLVPQAVEEGLRYASSVVNWRRIACQDTQIGDVAVAKGQTVLISLGAANHDPAKFDNPDVFDVTRANARQHIAFGNGMHFCIGMPLARLEIRIMIEELLQAFPDMRLAEDQTIDWVKTISFRGPLALKVELGA